LQLAEGRAESDYRQEVVRALTPLTTDTIIPPHAVGSRCTDLNGVLSRFTEPTVDQKIVLIVTDGRQNCGGDYSIKNVSNPRPNQIVIIMIVSGTEDDGLEDFELRRSRFAKACPQCMVVPFYKDDLDRVVDEAVRKRSSETAAENQL
jgi:hypothetical protein